MKDYFVWLAKLLTLVIVFFIIVPISLSAIFATAQKELLEQEKLAGSGVAVVQLKGMIDGTDEVVQELYKHAKNDKIVGIVLEIDSPGGAVGPSQAIFSAVQRLKEKKPIVAVMNTVAASGGLYAALGASKVLAQPGTLTGSIGVILQLPNFSGVKDKIGVDFVTIKSGQFKDAGNAFRPMTEPEKEYLQATVDVAYRSFRDAVAEGRNIPAEKVDQFADGRIILGVQAKEYGLIDGFGDVYVAARTVHELAGKPLKAEEFPTLIRKDRKYEQLIEFLESFFSLPAVFSDHPRLMYLMDL